MDLSEIDQRLRELVATIPPEVRAAMLEVPTADEQRRAKEIGGLHSLGLVPAMAELIMYDPGGMEAMTKLPVALLTPL